MAKVIEGIYRNGRVELREVPEGVPDGAAVQVVVPARALASVGDRQSRQAAMRRLLALLDAGIGFGGAPYPTREEIHDRELDRASRDD